jgi:hypothetical protein
LPILRGPSGPLFFYLPCYAAFLRIDRNRTFSLIAFCETAPGVRFNFFAICVPESFAFANAFKFFTSSLDHANVRLFAFGIIPPI